MQDIFRPSRSCGLWQFPCQLPAGDNFSIIAHRMTVKMLQDNLCTIEELTNSIIPMLYVLFRFFLPKLVLPPPIPLSCLPPSLTLPPSFPPPLPDLPPSSHHSSICHILLFVIHTFIYALSYPLIAHSTILPSIHHPSITHSLA